MSVPTLTSNGSLYQLRWADEQVIMTLDRFAEDSKYNVSCEVQIDNTMPGLPRHIHGGTRLNITSAESRRRLAKHLNDDVIPKNWVAILEQASMKVLEQWRKGSPIIEMSEHKKADRLAMRVMPILQERQATLIFGEGDSLKSFFAAYLAVLVRSGLTHAGLTPEPGNVLYLDYETDEDTTLQRFEMISTGLGIDVPGGLYYRYMHQPLAADAHQVSRLVMEYAIEFLVVDSAAPAVVEPESAVATTEYFKTLRSLRVTSLTIAHVTKATKDEYPFGSSFFRNLPRSNFRVRASRELEHVVIGLKHTKSNNGRRIPDMGFQFEFDGDNRVVIEPAQVRDVPELAQGLPLRERINGLLLRGPRSVEHLAEELEQTEGNVRTTLNRNKASFVRTPTGLWANLTKVV